MIAPTRVIFVAQHDQGKWASRADGGDIIASDVMFGVNGHLADIEGRKRPLHCLCCGAPYRSTSEIGACIVILQWPEGSRGEALTAGLCWRCSWDSAQWRPKLRDLRKAAGVRSFFTLEGEP